MVKKRCKQCQRIRWVAIFLCIAVILLLMMLGQTQAAIYKYTDSSGKKIYVGSLSQVPVEYQNQLVEQEPSGTVSNTSQFSEKNRSASSLITQSRQARRLARALELMETKVVIKNNQILVPVKVMYHGYSADVTMLMDTGATSTVFHQDALERLDPKQRAAGYARVAGGGVIKLSTIEFDTIKIGPYKGKNINAFVMNNKDPDGGFDGLLGMDFLMNVEYELDKERQVIIWNPKKYREMQKLAEKVAAEDAQSSAQTDK